jgi:cytochrome c-type biogenesis protein CcmH
VTEFLVLCGAMLVAALLMLLRPLVRGAPPSSEGESLRPSTGAAVALALVLPLGAAAVYALVSNYPWQDPRLLGDRAQTAHQQGAGSMDEVTEKLEARLAQNPEDLEGWQMLARTYLLTGQPAKAANALERALALTGGGNPDLELDLAEALVVSADPSVQDRAKAFVDAALEADPDNGKALWYSGVIALRSGDEATARQRWMRMSEQDLPEEIREMVNEQLAALGVEVPGSAPAAARGPMVAAATPSAAPDAAPPTGRMLNVSVNVDPALAAQLRPGTPLFVSARQPGIPGPPLAAVRLTTDAIPVTVTLSDANSMIEGRNLSSVEDVEIVARVALGGSVMTTSGDLIGSVVHAKGSAPDLTVVIDQVAP